MGDGDPKKEQERYVDIQRTKPHLSLRVSPINREHPSDSLQFYDGDQHRLLIVVPRSCIKTHGLLCSFPIIKFRAEIRYNEMLAPRRRRSFSVVPPTVSHYTPIPDPSKRSPTLKPRSPTLNPTIDNRRRASFTACGQAFLRPSSLAAFETWGGFDVVLVR